MGTYKIITYGCQMNVHESEKLAAILKAQGYLPTENTEEADVIVFNTCCVRENAERRAEGNIGALKQLKAQRPDLILAVCGCMTQQKGRAEALLKKFPFLDIVFGTYNFDEFGQYLLERAKEKKPVLRLWEKEGPIDETIGYERSNRVHAFVNIMYGCNNFCSYCIVPYVRGRERSRHSSDILKEVENLLANGIREITLLGQNVNSYGHDLPGELDFSALLSRIGEMDGKFRLRFMTSHPKDLNEQVVSALARYSNLCKCIHLPVQSGSTDVLRRMNRRYTAEDYLSKVEMIRSAIPDCGLTTDIMIGFPGEREEDFEKTLRLAETVRFDSAFTFVYSPRRGTPAAGMPDQIPAAVKKRRITALVALQNSISEQKAAQLTGRTLEVLTDGVDLKKKGYLCGRTESGRLVSFRGDPSLLGHFVQVKVLASGLSALTGEMI